MRVIIEPDYQALSQWAANYVASKINAANPTPEKPFVLGCPTGSSPLGMYKALIELNKQGKVSFQNVVTFNMDEYVGLPEDHPESYHTFMWKNFFNHIDIKKENVHILNGNAEDLEAECANYEKQIAEIGGIDLFMGCLLYTSFLVLEIIEFSPLLICSNRIRCKAAPETSVSMHPFFPQWQIISFSYPKLCPNSPEKPDFPL